MKRKNLLSTALLGLVVSAGVAFPAAVSAEPIALGESLRLCLVDYEPAGDGFDIDTLNACIHDAVALFLAEATTEQSTVENATTDTATVAEAVMETTTDGGINTAALESACGEGSVNTGILGSASC